MPKAVIKFVMRAYEAEKIRRLYKTVSRFVVTGLTEDEDLKKQK